MTKHLGTFRIDLDLWSQFKAVTAGEGSSASAEIIDFISRYLAGYRLPSSSAEEPSSSSIEALIDAHLAPVKQQLLDIEARLSAVQQASSSVDRQPSSKSSSKLKPVRQQKSTSENAVESPSSEPVQQSIVKQPQPATRKVAPRNYGVLPPDIGEGLNQSAICAFYGLSWKNTKRDSTAAGFDTVEGYLQVMTGIAWTRHRERKGFIFQPIPQKSPSENDLQGTSVNVVGQSLNPRDGLLQNDLCKRLGIVGHNWIAQKRRQGADALAIYTQKRDPDGKAWGYRDGRYYPVD